LSGNLRRSFAVTFTDEEDPDVMACLSDLDAVTARLWPLMAAGKCTFNDTLTEEIEPVRTVSYRTIFDFIKGRGGRSNVSKLAATVMQTLFDMRTPADERVIRFYCTDYHHTPGVCACPAVTWPARLEPRRLQYRSLRMVPVARLWLMDRADLLALTDEQLATINIHPNTREHVTDFIVWLRANPDAR
jgi:hypothetical protein